MAVQSGLRDFDVEFAITLLSQIAETANPPLLPGLTDRVYVRKCIVKNDELFNLLGECLQKGTFSEIRSLEMFQPVWINLSQTPHNMYSCKMHKICCLLLAFESIMVVPNGDSLILSDGNVPSNVSMTLTDNNVNGNVGSTVQAALPHPYPIQKRKEEKK
ncbi:hypothetical protein BU17DRAFT_72149 [Hysterangium stoloniferum]|nr:hypothetical protein BU17DRAFT_72149 [Hysterangium stoloniferum]